MKDFAVHSVKTGLGGATGNKGSVAFRLVLNSTSVCFVCSHFAAGQHEVEFSSCYQITLQIQVRDRNEDFATAMRKIRFPMGRDINSHDTVFWLGDFNYRFSNSLLRSHALYRINLSGEEVKRAVYNGHLHQLVPNDQLTQQKMQGLVGFLKLCWNKHF